MYTSLRLARTAEELHSVFRLRHQVFVEEERRFEHPTDTVFDLYDINCYVPLPGTRYWDELFPAQRDAIDWPLAGYKSWLLG